MKVVFKCVCSAEEEEAERIHLVDQSGIPAKSITSGHGTNRARRFTCETKMKRVLRN
jgi:hypothetical protein